MYEFANDQLGENKDPSYNPLNNKEKKSKKITTSGGILLHLKII